MNASEFLSQILDPGLAWCATVPGWIIKPDDRARVLLLAIMGQESSWTHRVQGGNGPAHSFAQMERRGGVQGVLTHAASWKMATAACVKAGVPSDATHVWGIMATPAGDDLAVAFARLLLWTDPHPLPGFGDADAGWAAYLRLWRPGTPRVETWQLRYAAALATI